MEQNFSLDYSFYFFFFIRNYENYSKLILKRGGKRIIRLEMLFKNWIYIYIYMEIFRNGNWIRKFRGN